MMKSQWLLAISAMLLLGCANAQKPQQMFDKASALTKLSAYVEANVLYGSSEDSESDQILINKAFSENTSLKPLLGLDDIRVLRGDKGIVIMVCTSDKMKSLLEDLSCTPEMDKHNWRDKPEMTCTFSLDPAACN